MLTDEGTTVVKVYLHISREEQRRRLQARLDDPTKRWKFRPEDLEARKQWDAYQSAYEEAITETSTDIAPLRTLPRDINRQPAVPGLSLVLGRIRRPGRPPAPVARSLHDSLAARVRWP